MAHDKFHNQPNTRGRGEGAEGGREQGKEGETEGGRKRGAEIADNHLIAPLPVHTCDEVLEHGLAVVEAQLHHGRPRLHMPHNSATANAPQFSKNCPISHTIGLIAAADLACSIRPLTPYHLLLP